MKIWEICKETGKSFNSCRGFLNHLRGLNMTSKQYYDKHYKQEGEGICYCGKDTTYGAFKYNKYCSDSCACKSLEHRKSVSEKFINNPSALESFRELRKNADIDFNIEKRNQTIQKECEKLGITKFEYHSIKSKKAFENMSEEKVKQRVLKRMETIESTTNDFGGRSGYKSFDFFGDTVSLQGYEPIVLESMIQDFNLTDKDIKIGKSNIPIIDYEFGGKNRMYFPDFFLPNNNLLIEVKSRYTYELHKDSVHEKCKACLSSGYSILVLIVSKHEARNGKLEGSKNLLDWAISSQAPKPTWYGEGSTTILME